MFIDDNGKYKKYWGQASGYWCNGTQGGVGYYCNSITDFFVQIRLDPDNNAKGGFEVNFYELFNEYETITDGEVTASNAYEDIAFDVACEELAQAFGENFDSRIDEYAMKEAAYEARQEMLYSTY